MSAKLYLIPVTLGDSLIENVIPALPLDILNRLDHFVVEDLRSARRYLRKAGMKAEFDNLQFYLLNEHSSEEELEEMLAILRKGESMGILSEAGVPAVADPGSQLVAQAHRLGIQVIPLVGPSSILLALMASGMNGQSFRFHGYLPVKKPQRLNRIRQIEKSAFESGETQIFMETPYRNMSLLDDLLNTCRKDTLLCVAADISLDTEFIKTKAVHEWRKEVPPLHKRPAIFLINRM
ncbi:MAG: SAM-dependent methyltransferase [Bacteroidales bacterium]|nr:SAM-dependent methyltransferase [Bacteroidales bacterium]